MKSFYLIFIAASMFLSCSIGQNDESQDYIPGVYVKEIRQEFAVGMDTITIKLLNKHASTYTITRKSNYQQMIDGRILTPKVELHKWIAFYDQEKRRLIEPNNERVFTFFPDKNALLMGTSKYKKVDYR